jgi:hypothetical protein
MGWQTCKGVCRVCVLVLGACGACQLWQDQVVFVAIYKDIINIIKPSTPASQTSDVRLPQVGTFMTR